MTEWMRGNELEKRKLNGDLGGTMRLGAYPAKLAKGSRVAKIYGDTQISERHRHRYEVNTQLSRAAGGGRYRASAACHRTGCCRRSSSCPSIPGSSACGSPRAGNRVFSSPHPLVLARRSIQAGGGAWSVAYMV